MGRTALTGLLAALALAGTAASAGVLAPTPSRVILANDNRVPAGALSHGVLRIALDARNGLWYPDGPNGADLPVEAFGESGRAPQIPGPLIRVPVGTEIVARIRNSMPGAVVSVVSSTRVPATWRPLAVDGADLPATLRIAQPAIATITIGQTRDFLFEPRAPGEYKLMFWGSSRGRLRMTIPVHVVATTVGKVQQ